MRQTEIASEPGSDAAEFTVDGGCVVCGGPMAVRVTPGAARGYCPRCAWISRPLVWQAGGGLAIAHPPLALA
ncbi:MAG TPA: hypothetical protein VMT17_10355 [Anaeromyxobacteraceae bacterium]|nr:hypothetical protein [Anaeromyxobacteraceae bacterium]